MLNYVNVNAFYFYFYFYFTLILAENDVEDIFHILPFKIEVETPTYEIPVISTAPAHGCAHVCLHFTM